jgi:predicted nucleotidyltransferase
MVLEFSHRRLSDAIKPRAAKRLRDFRSEVEQRFPGRVKSVVLFGSRARGDARDGSDYDVAVFIENLKDRRCIDHALSDLAFRHILAGFHIRPVALPDNYLTSPQRGMLASNIARDGVVVI